MPRENGTGVFVLVKTSNPSSGQLQDLRFEDGRTLYQAVADLVEEWGEETRGESGYSAVGAVVGATYPQQGVELRERMPHAFFPRAGLRRTRARGTDIAGCFDAGGNSAIVNAFPLDPLRVEEARGWRLTRPRADEALRMKQDLCDSLAAVGKAIGEGEGADITQDTAARVLSCETMAQDLVRIILSAPEYRRRRRQFVHILVPDSGHGCAVPSA